MYGAFSVWTCLTYLPLFLRVSSYTYGGFLHPPPPVHKHTVDRIGNPFVSHLSRNRSERMAFRQPIDVSCENIAPSPRGGRGQWSSTKRRTGVANMKTPGMLRRKEGAHAKPGVGVAMPNMVTADWQLLVSSSLRNTCLCRRIAPSRGRRDVR